MEQNSSPKRFSGTLIIVAVCLILSISMVSALDIISVTPLEKVGVDWDNVDSFLKDKTTSAYGKYEIRNSVLVSPSYIK